MRIINALLSCILVASVGAGTASLAVASPDDTAASRAQRVRVSIDASPLWVKKGGIVTLSGRVQGVTGRVEVTILQKTKGTSSWSVEAVKRTSRKGRFTHREDVTSGDRSYKACVKRACDSVLVHMGKPPAAATAVGITGLSVAAVEAGQAFTVSGVASGNLNGRAVEVQAYDGASSTWGAVGRAVVQGGVWSAPTAVTTAGRSVPLRAAFTGGVGLKPSSSTASSVTVYGWYYVNEQFQTVEGDGGWRWRWGSFKMNGADFEKSVGAMLYYSGTRTNQIDLGRSCTTYRATIGIDDSTATTAQATVSLYADAVSRWTRSGLRLGSTQEVQIDVTNALRLRFDVTPTGSGEGYAVFGNGQVLCAF
jgi:hypothetical protein